MSKYRVFGAFLTLATWSSTYVPATAYQAGNLRIGAAVQADVRWTPNPDRGSASSTLSGGRRSTSASACAVPNLTVTLLVPDGATALTTEAQPTLSWYLESDQKADMKFVLFHPDKAAPVYTEHVRAGSGLVEVALPKSAALALGTRYRWTVFVTHNGGANEVHARSFIERVADSDLESTVGFMTPTERADAYAAKECTQYLSRSLPHRPTDEHAAENSRAAKPSQYGGASRPVFSGSFSFLNFSPNSFKEC